MKTRLTLSFLAAAASCLAQHWEVGASAGAGFIPGASVTSPQGSAKAGFQTGVTFGAFVGQNLYRHLSGEVRYAFMQRNLKLSSSGTEATFSGVQHAIHYDVLIHPSRKESRVLPFAVVGGGLKVFHGTGKEQAYQPLSQFGYFTKTTEVKPLLTLGGGVKFAIAQHLNLRAEFRDFITMFPKELIAPAPGAKFGSMLHDFVPMIGISYEY
jgi:hypothetical protein